MSERKAINKYYGNSNNYDPISMESKLKKQAKHLKTLSKKQTTIRLMTPFSITCNKCNTYISKFKKFNGKKETLEQKYLNKVKIYRLSIKCPSCNNMISFRTDPASADYIMEEGATRNFQSDKNNKINNPDTKNDTIDDILEKLLAEEERESQDNGANNASVSTMDKMEEIENKLSKIQKEQEDDAILESLQMESRLRMEKERDLLSSGNITKDNTDDERIVEQAFREHYANGGDEDDGGVVEHAAKSSVIKFKKKKKCRTKIVI
ncbi:related to Protein CWC16 [Saccharomycodes ludwigii]|uniref:Related to Protein CWC16 n=1 Tax=Saccharomycodes ludwigii TaxID=36035 RepID=A0A376B326_9ASCO|nr:related to Protein CWC16 [Saccharomycodes ludwigii]